ncbi:MAG: energy transducer TonB [Candidatus Sulfotelmatobacter sp.]
MRASANCCNQAITLIDPLMGRPEGAAKVNECNGDFETTDLRSRRMTAGYRFHMRHCLCFGVVLLIFGDLLFAAQSQANPSDALKPSATPTSVTASESLPKVCSQTNPPPCATPPRVVSKPPSTFSRPAGTNKKGICVLSVIVEPDGRASHIRVMKGLDIDLDEEAIHEVKMWKFKPATLNGKAVAVQIAVEVAFNII